MSRLLLVVVCVVGVWWFLKTPGGCRSCHESHEKFVFILSPPGSRLGDEKLAWALAHNTGRFRVVFWEEEVTEKIQHYLKSDTSHYQLFRSQILDLLRSIPPTDDVVWVTSDKESFRTTVENMVASLLQELDNHTAVERIK